jgi:hypothetical protein
MGRGFESHSRLKNEIVQLGRTIDLDTQVRILHTLLRVFDSGRQPNRL